MKKNKAKSSHTTEKGNTKRISGIVTSIRNKQVEVLVGETELPCLIPGSLAEKKYALGVGDHVEVEALGNEQYKLIHVLPRKATLYRGNRRNPGGEIPVAANAQYLIALVTADYLLNQAGYLESAIIAARRAGMEVGVLISKWDLTSENTKSILQQRLVPYEAIADYVFVGADDSKLIPAVKGKTIVVVGDRKCGKTTVVRNIIGGLQNSKPQAGSIPGTHTSTLHIGPENTLLIDTPGFRDFALQGITAEERDMVFPEIVSLANTCQFSNCSHTHEKGCRVIQALRTNQIFRERYQAYQKLVGNNLEIPKADYRHSACAESFTCKVCGTLVLPEDAGTQHRNHCPNCLSSIHVDEEPGDRVSLCHGTMEPVSVWVRKNGEWAIIHRCKLCGAFHSNRIAADDNPMLLMSIAVRPLSSPPFPLNDLGKLGGQ